MKKVIFTIVLIALTSIPGSSYITKRIVLGTAIVPLKWSGFPVSWVLVSAQGSNITGSRTQSQVANTSFATWDAIATATIAFTRSADAAASATYGIDGINLVKTNMTVGEYAATGAGDALAITSPAYNTLTGEFVDEDILFNPAVAFSTETTTPANQYDFESVLTHEIGHLLGLDHSAILSATMFPRIDLGVSSLRALSSDDIAGVSSLYPTGSYLTKGSISGTVRLPTSASVYGAIVVAVDANGLPVAHGVSDPSGKYTIYGLSPGAYTIYAEPMDAPFAFDDQKVLGAIYPGSTVSTSFTTRFK